MPVIVLLHVLAVVAGLALVFRTLLSAIQTFVLPRAISDTISRLVFLSVRALFDLRASRATSYGQRDSVMAMYAPVALLTLTATWLAMVVTGYTLIFWGLSTASLVTAFVISGSSLFTLGYSALQGAGAGAVIFTEAGIGLLLAALLVAYLPTIYGSWSRREQAVALLEVRAGSPPTSWEMVLRYYRIGGLDAFNAIWPSWESWFLDVEESHTSLAALSFFRSPQPDRSWINAAGVVMDAAALLTAAVDVPREPQRELTIRAGYIALRRIASLFRIPYNPTPEPGDAISIEQEEFFAVYDMLVAEGIPMKPDREQAWRDFAGWRVNYDSVLLSLARLTLAPYAPWISDRSVRWHHPARAWKERVRRIFPG